MSPMTSLPCALSGARANGWRDRHVSSLVRSKDSLLQRAREMFADTPDVVFPRRIVTRPASDAEDHDTTSPDAFEQMRDSGAFAISWDAHGLKYALPASVDIDIGAARCVVCNVSRAILPELRRRYARVVTILVTAPPDILLARIASRARSTDGHHGDRLARSAGFDRTLTADLVIDNSGSLDDGARELRRAIDGQRVVTGP
jgi:ribose 1,5-bisphosphokinase